ncbi:peptidoglycan DD-metalloendopeptidase family protein [Clostridium sp. A1-XYC3]|uniref:Peptidoglycan DD-metalloendopeptidase family protein n=1 Tax=Clostridium tanneri TaxID=3037988 RepID=A0ABU4JXK0_9CLOT|nr:peptidoglycan DD-metalloendopeptidase family protein [Clostridium sp. A1-XYC3]MDW8802879.1 peptidoglycan DD-metalloendopeptidase family protein [Clostridium sp. A1-XYC3]
MRRGIVFIISLAISSSLVSTVYAANLQENQKKLNEINQSIQEKKSKLEDINSNKSDVEKEMNALDKEMGQVSSKLQELNKNIISLNSQIKIKEKEIDEKKKEFDREEDLFKERARAMYKSGSTGYVDVILNSSDFSDLLNRVEMVRRIMDYDKRLLAYIDENKKSLESKKSQLEDNKKKIVSLKSEADEKYKVLQEKSNEKKNLVSKLEKDKRFYENMISKEQSESEEIAKVIQQARASEGTKTNPSRGTSSSPSSTSVKTNGKLYSVTGGSYPITSPFGMRFHPVLGYSRLHAGMDIGVPMGTPVYALKDGVVIAAQSMSGYGNVVMINHGDITTVYGHNSSLDVSVGQSVKGGQLISHSGNTGVSSGPHLHFEVRNSSGQPIEPSGYYK